MLSARGRIPQVKSRPPTALDRQDNTGAVMTDCMIVGHIIWKKAKVYSMYAGNTKNGSGRTEVAEQK